MVAYAGTTSDIKCECVCIELESISDRASLKGTTWEKKSLIDGIVLSLKGKKGLREKRIDVGLSKLVL